ncbi:hypothetical protein [Anthocerotibacter panamensis]|uniref:hypothetical protein n=1 Tax=Anthocerotibacter panamensis TaxID=2857077 RepID=UPI001C4027E2|nr:hypothetical protein [Anthocerotibacter panamensis]
MTEDAKTPNTKRQELLQRMRDRRGEARRTETEEPQPTSGGLESDTFMDTFQRLRNLKASLSKGGDIASQISQLDANDPLLGTLMQMREARRKKKQGGGEEAINEIKDPAIQAFMGRRKKKKDAQKTTNEKALAPDSFKSMQQTFSASTEADLSTTSLEELEQRKKEVQYRCDWLSGLLQEMQKELTFIQTHIDSRK